MSQCWRVLRDTKVCSESVLESLEITDIETYISEIRENVAD